MVKAFKYIGIGMLVVVPVSLLLIGVVWTVTYKPLIGLCVMVSAGLIYIAYLIGRVIRE